MRLVTHIHAHMHTHTHTHTDTTRTRTHTCLALALALAHTLAQALALALAFALALALALALAFAFALASYLKHCCRILTAVSPLQISNRCLASGSLMLALIKSITDVCTLLFSVPDSVQKNSNIFLPSKIKKIKK
jgi:hypothetical protein